MSDINRCQFFERGPEARARCGRLLEAQQEAEREAAAKVARLAERPTSGALLALRTAAARATPWGVGLLVSVMSMKTRTWYTFALDHRDHRL